MLGSSRFGGGGGGGGELAGARAGKEMINPVLRTLSYLRTRHLFGVAQNSQVPGRPPMVEYMPVGQLRDARQRQCHSHEGSGSRGQKAVS